MKESANDKDDNSNTNTNGSTEERDTTSTRSRDGDVDGDVESQSQTQASADVYDVYAVSGMAGKLLILQEEDMRQQRMARQQQQQQQQQDVTPVSQHVRVVPPMTQPALKLENPANHVSQKNQDKDKDQEKTTKEAECEKRCFLETKKQDGQQPVNAQIPAITVPSTPITPTTSTSTSISVTTSTTDTHSNRNHQDMLVGALAIGGSGLPERTEEMSTSSVGSSTSGATGRHNHASHHDGTSHALEDLSGLVEANQVDPMTEMPQAVAVLARETKRPMPWTRQDCFWATMALLFIVTTVGVVVGAVCGAGLCTDGTNTVPTAAAQTPRQIEQAPKIEVVITSLLGWKYFEQVEQEEAYDSATAEFMLESRKKAFDWIVNQDPMQLEFDATNLVQRFLLVLLYYQTTRHQPWKNCNPPKNLQSSGLCYEPEQFGGIIKPDGFTGELTATIWGDQWLTKTHECMWAGVTCETVQSREKTVVGLNIWWNELNGPLPWEITRLSQLKKLLLDGNMLTGVLPPGLLQQESSHHLDSILLSWNQLSGTIPNQWSEYLLEGSGKLLSLNMDANRLTGTIPSEVGLFPLKQLMLRENKLMGSLPKALFQQTSLETLRLTDNSLSGSIPSEIGLLTGLRYLDLDQTDITGSFPSEIGLATVMREIHVSYTNMQGTLPEELFKLTELMAFAVNDCNFSGTISSSVGQLSWLIWLHLANNNFHGTIPNEIAALTTVNQVLVDGNDLTGTFPVSACENFFALDDGNFKVVADCLPNTDTGVPAIECASSCCTSCCDETGLCLAN